MINSPESAPIQCGGSAAVSAAAKPTVNSAAAGPLPTGAAALESAAEVGSDSLAALTFSHPLPPRCETCGQFVPRTQLRTARRHYAIDHDLPVAVYSEATAVVLQQLLACPGCSMTDCLMDEAQRGHGAAVGPTLPGGWEPCLPTATQADYATAQAPA